MQTARSVIGLDRYFERVVIVLAVLLVPGLPAYILVRNFLLV